MFREIRTSERITDRDEEVRRNERLMDILDKRLTKETVEELKNFKKNEAESTFDPDRRIVVG